MLVLQKNQETWGPRGKLTNLAKSAIVVDLIDEARAFGVRLESACEIVDINVCIYQRWTDGDQVK